VTGTIRTRTAVLVAMSGGVDSSVAAARLVEAGYDVTGVTMKLWGGASDTGCCSVSDVDDARRVAQQLDIPFHVFNFGDDFTARVVEPYVDAHARGLTPNPCIECNRHLKFDALLHRAAVLGFELVATGHHARIVCRADGTRRLARGADAAKDQSYVLYMLGQDQLRRVLLPVGSMTKADVRLEARRLGLRTAAKPDSQDVCFITSTGGRSSFLGDRIPLRAGRVLDTAGTEVGRVDAVELVTVGQRRGLSPGRDGRPRYALDVDVATATVTIGSAEDLLTDGMVLDRVVWSGRSRPGDVSAQCSAHGAPIPACIDVADRGGGDRVVVRWTEPRRRVAPGQSVVFYDGDEVLGGGIVAALRSAPAAPGTGADVDPAPAGFS
jgi:tRNA-specific 2-thiouridylase